MIGVQDSHFIKFFGKTQISDISLKISRIVPIVFLLLLLLSYFDIFKRLSLFLELTEDCKEGSNAWLKTYEEGKRIIENGFT